MSALFRHGRLFYECVGVSLCVNNIHNPLILPAATPLFLLYSVLLPPFQSVSNITQLLTARYCLIIIWFWTHPSLTVRWRADGGFAGWLGHWWPSSIQCWALLFLLKCFHLASSCCVVLDWLLTCAAVQSDLLVTDGSADVNRQSSAPSRCWSLNRTVNLVAAITSCSTSWRRCAG